MSTFTFSYALWEPKVSWHPRRGARKSNVFSGRFNQARISRASNRFTGSISNVTWAFCEERYTTYMNKREDLANLSVALEFGLVEISLSIESLDLRAIIAASRTTMPLPRSWSQCPRSLPDVIMRHCLLKGSCQISVSLPRRTIS